MLVLLFSYLGALALCGAAAAAFAGSGSLRLRLRLAEGASVFAIALAVLGAVWLALHDPVSSPVLGGLLAARADIVSVIMLLLVSTIGWVVIRYSATYLRNEAGQSRFVGWICLTLAAILLFVSAGTLVQLVLAWILATISLDRLLLFYADRAGARRAQRKKFISSRIGEVALVLAAILLWSGYGTQDIGAILAGASVGLVPTEAPFAAACLAIAAIMMSAQFPAHGWLTEAMETPTPVSALLHAGVVNAGGFLLIRFADVMLLAPGILAALVVVGGFSALVASLVMLTQPAVKTSLAWSTVAQMGFMIFQCGLALFPLALLHIVAHSFYKAHGFLTSGGAVESVAAIARPGPVAIADGKAVGTAFLIAIAIYAVIAALFGIGEKSVQTIALGAILIFGVAYLLAQGLADAAPRELTWRTAVYSLGATIGYFTLQTIAEWLTAGTLPSAPQPGPLEWVLMVCALISFGVVAVAQSTFPLWAYHPASRGLRVHLANGLYANAIADRMVGGWRTAFTRTTLTNKDVT